MKHRFTCITFLKLQNPLRLNVLLVKCVPLPYFTLKLRKPRAEWIEMSKILIRYVPVGALFRTESPNGEIYHL